MATRKKEIQASPGIVKCPACQSEISFNGANFTLHSRSPFLEGLIETDAGVDDLEKTIGKLEEKLAAAKKEAEDLRAQLAQGNKKPEVKENVGTQGKDSSDSGRNERRERRSSWW